MRLEQEQIHTFMVKAGQETPDKPVMPEQKVRELRVRLIAEELLELANAYGLEVDINNRGGTVDNIALWQVRAPTEEDLVEAYDAVIDLLVVVLGSGVAMGTDIAPGWDEVHRSNMAKFGPGGYKRSDGKWMKPPNWTKPDLAALLRAQLEIVCRKTSS